jgi:hypothetical protein
MLREKKSTVIRLNYIFIFIEGLSMDFGRLGIVHTKAQVLFYSKASYTSIRSNIFNH